MLLHEKRHYDDITPILEPFHHYSTKTSKTSPNLYTNTTNKYPTTFPNSIPCTILLLMNINDPRVEENLNELARTLAKSGNPGFIKDLLRCLLTPSETADIAARWALVKALKQKTPQRQIAKDLGISLCKIVRGSRELKKPGSAFQKIATPKEQP